MKLNIAESPYQVLGVERNAADAEIRRAYFTLVRDHPPERDPDGFKRIRAAYEALRHREERVQTDLFLIEVGPVPEPSAYQPPTTEPAPLSLEIIRADLLAIEGYFLEEELALREVSE